MNNLSEKLIGSFAADDIVIINSDNHFEHSSKYLKLGDKKWKEMEKANKKIWNGLVYRLIDWAKKETSLVLHLGTINYKDLMVIKDIPLDEREKDMNSMLVVALIKTKNNKYVLAQVSDNTAVYGGSITSIGGSLNKDEMEINTGADLFTFMKHEIQEEIKVSDDQINRLDGLGIYTTKIGKVVVFFYAELNCDSTYFEGIDLTFEHKGLLFLSLEELQTLIKDNESVHEFVGVLLNMAGVL